MEKFKKSKQWFAIGLAALLLVIGAVTVQATEKIVHDTEYYILEAQNAEKWAADDKAVDAKLAENNVTSCRKYSM